MSHGRDVLHFAVRGLLPLRSDRRVLAGFELRWDATPKTWRGELRATLAGYTAATHEVVFAPTAPRQPR